MLPWEELEWVRVTWNNTLVLYDGLSDLPNIYWFSHRYTDGNDGERRVERDKELVEREKRGEKGERGRKRDWIEWQDGNERQGDLCVHIIYLKCILKGYLLKLFGWRLRSYLIKFFKRRALAAIWVK